MRKRKKSAEITAVLRSSFSWSQRRREETRPHARQGEGQRAVTFLESECIEFFRGVAVERRDFEEEGKRDINTYSNHIRRAAAFQKCWNSCDGWLRLIRNELELAARVVQSLKSLVGDFEHEPVHGMMVQVRGRGGRAKES